MANNPYAHCLGELDARAVYASSPGRFHQAVCALTPEQLETPIAVGKWSPRMIVAHMADCELGFSFRMRQVLAAPIGNPAILQSFDQDAWARHYQNYTVPEALETFRAVRGWNVKLLGTLSQADFDRSGNHPERGAVNVMDIVELSAGHDLNHLAQLELLATA